METNVKIKIVFRNEEKTLENPPETYEELKEQFFALFNQTKQEINYAFKYDEISYISEEKYEDNIEFIKDMDDPIIFVEEIKPFKPFSNKSLAISIYNDENSNTNSNNDNNINNNNSNDSNDNNRNIIINNIINNNNIFDQNKTVGDTKLIIPNVVNREIRRRIKKY